MTIRTKVLFLLLAMLGAISVRAYAQQKTSEKISPKERWAFETNAMDWLLLLPMKGRMYVKRALRQALSL